jgi:alpha-L-fucosidase
VLPHKWEDSDTISTSWGYNRHEDLSVFKSFKELIIELVEVVSTGGNLLLGVGPTSDGLIPIIVEERLKQMGQWLSCNGEAIYFTSPWRIQNDTSEGNIWYTFNNQTQNLYAVSTSIET